MNNLIRINISDDKEIIVGEVTKVEEGVYKNNAGTEMAKMTITLSGEVYKSETNGYAVENVIISMKDDDYSMLNFEEKPDGSLNDSTMLVKLWKEREYKVGDCVSFLVNKSNNNLYAQRFKKSGLWKCQKNDKEFNVLIGTVIPSKYNKRNDDENFRVWNCSVPVSQGMGNPSKFIQVAFWNSPAHDDFDENLMATKASKVLFSTTDESGNNSYKKAVIVTGPIVEKKDEEKGYINYQTSGRRFYRIDS